MTPDLASTSALAMRRRVLRRKRLERVGRIVHQALAALGFTFIVLLIGGAF